MSLYCGVVKLHSVNSEVARSVIESFHLTRDGFLEKAEVVLGRAIPKDVISLLRDAEKTRDKVMHGKKTLDSEKRQALAKAIEYATGFKRIRKRGWQLRAVRGSARVPRTWHVPAEGDVTLGASGDGFKA